jgi:hypothetical protein
MKSALNFSVDYELIDIADGQYQWSEPGDMQVWADVFLASAKNCLLKARQIKRETKLVKKINQETKCFSTTGASKKMLEALQIKNLGNRHEQ